MKKNTKFSAFLDNVNLQLYKHKPEIMLTAGVGGLIFAGVLAVKQTFKAKPIVDEYKKMKEETATGNYDIVKYDNPEFPHGTATDKMALHHLNGDDRAMTVAFGLEMVKLYALPTVIAAGGAVLAFASNNEMKKRAAVLSMAYSGLATMYDKYRERVVEKYGEAEDLYFRTGISKKTVKKTVVDENGNKVKVTEDVYDVNLEKADEYSIFFDETCTGWTKDSQANKTFLLMQQAYANEKLRMRRYTNAKGRGFLFLNEVYTMLGLPETAEGQVVGWVYDPSSDKFANKVDFGIFDIDNNGRFVNGLDKVPLLTFNVDGMILNDI